MRKLLTIFTVTVLTAIFITPDVSASPWMHPLKTCDDWAPFKTYRNLIGVRVIEAEEEELDDWSVGICITKFGKNPVKKREHENWINGEEVPFTFVFTKETGMVEFTIGDVPTLSYILPQYIDRGTDEIHIAVNSFYEYENFWTYCFITELQINGESYNFVDVEGDGTYTYTTISGLGCADFVLTGKLCCNWIGKMPQKRRQAIIRLGEPCGPDHDPQIEPSIDLTGDCVIDFKDFAILASEWLNTCPEPNSCYGCDFNQDQVVDHNDLSLFADQWLDRKYAGGCGTKDSPYLIATARQLNSIGANPDDWGAHFKLQADIDLSEHTGNSFNTIGTPNSPFTGVFDGDNWQISFFTQGDGAENYVGLFRCVNDANAVIKNLRLYKPNVVTENPNYAGALAASFKNGTIINCSVDQGEITGYGGYALTTGANFVGGLIGYNENGTIINCSTKCDISGYDKVGGLIGYNKAGTIEESFAVGTTISAHDWVGGLIGKNEEGIIKNSYAQKSVFAHDWVGGFIGEDVNGVVEDCYSTGYVSENSDYRGGFIGFIGENSLVVDYCLWDIETGGSLNNNNIGVPASTATMKSESTFISAGWDLTSPVWIVYDAYDYPFLFWTLKPYPNPMVWESPPEPNGAYEVIMTAKTATAYDYNGVEYYFNNMTDPNHDSGWQDSSVYVDTDVIPQTEYTYRVKVSDITPARNESEYSQPATVLTAADTTCPEPEVMTWDAVPHATGPHTIAMTATTATDEVGVEYFFHNLSDPCHDSGWQDETFYEDTGLDDLTTYTYTVKARDKSANQNETYWAFSKSATTPDGTAPQPDPMTWQTAPTATGAHTTTMTATDATDASGVEYYFHNVTDPSHDSNGWQADTTYIDTGLDELTLYTYQVKARDKSFYKNEGTYSTEASTTTLADTTPPEPNIMTWAVLPAAVSPYSIEMTATTATDAMGVEYYFNNITDPIHDSNWQDSTFYKDTNLEPDTTYTYQVKARDKSQAQNETAYSTEQSAQTPYATPPAEENWTFVSIGTLDGRIYNGSDANVVDGDTDNQALRLGDFSSGEEYQNILTFDTSLLPADCNITSVTVQMTRGYEPAGGQNPFDLFGNCIIDVANPYFGDNIALEVNDWNDAGCAYAVAMFPGDPCENKPMVSTEFDANGQSCININGTTQLRVYFENSTNGDAVADYLGFYSGEYMLIPEYRPKLIINYTTRTAIVEFASIASEDGRVWDIGDNGIGEGNDVDDTNDLALRLGDYSGYEVPDSAGYRSVVSFDTSLLPDNCTLLSAHLLLTRGAEAGSNPFGWAGDCLVDIAAPYFGNSSALEDCDWESPATVSEIAGFWQDPGDDKLMLSTQFNTEGLNSISLDGKTQLRFYFTMSTNLDTKTDYLGFYSGDSTVLAKQPKLLIRYSN